MPSRHTVRRRGRAVSDRSPCSSLEVAPGCEPTCRDCTGTRGLIALTLLPQARDTKVAATLEKMRARCSC